MNQTLKGNLRSLKNFSNVIGVMAMLATSQCISAAVKALYDFTESFAALFSYQLKSAEGQRLFQFVLFLIDKVAAIFLKKKKIKFEFQSIDSLTSDASEIPEMTRHKKIILCHPLEANH